MICSEKRITAGSPFHFPHRDELIELCERHGEMKYDVHWIEYDVIDAPLLRFGLFRYDEDGKKYVDEDTGTAASTTVEHALIGDLPDWWRPA